MVAALALLLTAGCASEASNTTDATVDQSTPLDATATDLGPAPETGIDATPSDAPIIDARVTDTPPMDIPRADAPTMDSTVPRCVPGMTAFCACFGGLTGVQTCTATGIYGACVCPDAGTTTDVGAIDVPARPLGPRLITPQSISRTTTQRPTFRWVLPEGVTRARVTVARNRALTMDARTGMTTGTSWRPTEPLPFAVWFWRVEGLGDDGGVVWTSPTWEFRAPRRDTAVDSSWGTWRDFNGDGYDDLALSGADMMYRGGPSGLSMTGESLRDHGIDSDGFRRDTYSPRVTDLNGDGFSDLVLLSAGRRFVDAGAGSSAEYVSSIYVYWGRSTGLSGAPDAELNEYGGPGSCAYGNMILGDFDGDGFGDILTVAEELSALKGRCRIGLMYAGAESGVRLVREVGNAFPVAPEFIGINESAADLDLDGYQEFSLRTYITLPDGLRRTPFSVLSLVPQRALVPEFPPDTLALLFSTDIDGYGRVEVIRGLASEVLNVYRWTDRGLEPTGWPTISAPDIPSGIATNVFGLRLTAGDVNGDGYADLLASAPEAPFIDSTVNPRGDGSVYLYLGSSGGLSPVAATWRGRSHSSSSIRDNYGSSTACPGDCDGDGFDDVAITANGSPRVELRYGALRQSEVGVRSTTLAGFRQGNSGFAPAR